MTPARNTSPGELLVALGLLVVACSGDPGPGSVSSASPPTSDPAPTGECRTAPSGPTTYQYAMRSGIDPDLNSLDLYLPANCGPVPVVMWVHGGGWRLGDKATGQIEQKAAWATSLGWAFVSINYRLSSPDTDIRWPDHGEDVAAAVAWIQSEGTSLGLDTVDLTLVGHSAGAHLVAILATHPLLMNEAGGDSEGIACVVPLDFSFDLATAPGRALIANAFGTDPVVLADASPNVQIEESGAPTARFLVGTRGGPARVAEAQDFVDLITSAGGTADLLNANPYSHSQISSQLGAPNETIVTPMITRFIESCTTKQGL